MEPDAAEKELWHYDMTPDAKAAWDANGMDGAVTGESPVIVSFTTMGYDRGYRAGLAASPSEEVLKLADELAHRVTVMEADHSLKYPLDILIRDSKVVSRAVDAFLAARAALRTTKEGER